MKEQSKTFLNQVILYAAGLADKAKSEAGDDEQKLDASNGLLSIYHSLITKLNNDEPYTLEDWGFIVVAMKFMNQNMSYEYERTGTVIQVLNEIISKLETLVNNEEVEKINELFQSKT